MLVEVHEVAYHRQRALSPSSLKLLISIVKESVWFGPGDRLAITLFFKVELETKPNLRIINYWMSV